MKLLFLLLISSASYGQYRVSKVTATSPLTVTGTSQVVIKVDTFKLVTVNKLASTLGQTRWDASAITSGKLDTARLPIQYLQQVSKQFTGTNTLQLTDKPASVQLFINGSRSNSFTLTGSTITITKTVQPGDVIIADYFK